MLTFGRFSVTSDSKLATDVGNGATVVPEVRGHLPFETTPADILFAAGRATAAAADPDRLRFITGALWAIVRWFWTLEVDGGELKVAPTVQRVRNHHRTALSEALGLGSCLLLAEYLLFGGSRARPITAATRGLFLLDVDTYAPRGTRPDLVLFQSNPVHDPRAAVIVLEAKGNSESKGDSRGRRSLTYSQLRRGLDQVRTVHVEGRPGRGLVIATRAPEGPLESLALQTGQLAGPLPLRTLIEGASIRERRRRLAFAGLLDGVTLGRRTRLEIAGREFVGSEFVVANAERRVAVATVLPARLAEALLVDADDVEAAMREVFDEWQGMLRTSPEAASVYEFPATSRDSTDTPIVRIVDPESDTTLLTAADGCGLVIRTGAPAHH
jgi:hypothetical protein